MTRVSFRMLAAVVLVCGVGCDQKVGSQAGRVDAGAPRREEILIGLVGPLTGPLAEAGIATRRGIELAVAQVNAEGGVGGRPLRLRVYDDQGRPEEAGAAATRLIVQDEVKLILGHVASASSMVIADKAQAARVPQISSAATSPEVTSKGDYIFRVCFIDPVQGAAMARFAREKLGARRVAVLRDGKSTYSLGLSDAFTRWFKELGGEVVATETFTQGDTDFRAALTRIKAARPDALYVPVYAPDAGLVARQSRELGLKVTLLGGDGWDAPSVLLQMGGAPIEGSYFSDHYSAENPSPRGRRFVEAYRAAYGEEPGSLAALGYDSAMLAADALRRAKELSGPAIREALAATHDFPGVTGSLSFDRNRNPIKPAMVLQVSSDGFKYVTTVQP